MEQRPPLQLLAYETWSDADGHHARYTGHLSELAITNGCVVELHDENPAELFRRAIANRVRAWAYERWIPRNDGRTSATPRHQP